MADDMYKIAVNVIMIHLIVIFLFEGFTIAGNNPSDSIVLEKLSALTEESNNVSDQIPTIGLCLEGTATQTECEARGCRWDSGVCYNAVEDRTGVDYGFFDVILSVIKIPIYLGKFLLVLGSVVFYELIISYKMQSLLPGGEYFVVRWLITIALWCYNLFVIYYLWAFISNWRGQR